MRIKDLTVTMFEWNDIPTVVYGAHNPKTTNSSELGLVTVTTDDGVEGHGFLGSSFRSAALDAHSLIDQLKPLVIGQDPLERERLHRSLYKRWRATSYRAIGAVDLALWDIAGKVAGMPIHKMLGGYRRKVRAYASSSTLPNHAAYMADAERVLARGFRAYKLHPPHDLDECIKVCRDVRKFVGPDIQLMIDPAGAFDFPQAMRLGRVLEELDFLWYEDPLHECDIYNYSKLCAKLDIPIMATEYAPGGYEAYAAWITAKATDYLRGDVAIKGGLTPMVKLAHLAEGFQMNLEVHHGGNSLANVANLHLIMAIRNSDYFEVLLPDAAQKYGLVEDIEVDKDGYVHCFDAPGLGAQIDFDLIKRKKIGILT